MTEKMTPELQEARDFLVKAFSDYDALITWCTGEAPHTLIGLQEQWRSLCSGSVDEVTPILENKGNDIIEACVALRESLFDRASAFTRSIPRMLGIVEDMTSEDSGFMKLAKEIVTAWRQGFKSELMRFYENTCQLEDEVRDMMDKINQGVSA